MLEQIDVECKAPFMGVGKGSMLANIPYFKAYATPFTLQIDEIGAPFHRKGRLDPELYAGYKEGGLAGEHVVYGLLQST